MSLYLYLILPSLLHSGGGRPALSSPLPLPPTVCVVRALGAISGRLHLPEIKRARADDDGARDRTMVLREAARGNDDEQGDVVGEKSTTKGERKGQTTEKRAN